MFCILYQRLSDQMGDQMAANNFLDDDDVLNDLVD